MAAPPNILLITTDQMRKDHLGCYGNPVIRTPHLDRLAAEGVCLDRAYVNNPVCMPNRATIATGRLPRNHGCWCNGVPLAKSERTIGDVLAARGYATALLGKGHLTATQARAEDEDPFYESRDAWRRGLMTTDWAGPYYGFQECRLSIGHGTGDLGLAHYGAWLEAHFPGAAGRALENRRPSPTGAPQAYTPDLPVEAHPSSWLGRIGSEWLRARAADGRPFCLWVSFPDPHHPFNPPAPYDAMYDPAGVVMPRLGPEALADKPPYFRRAYAGGEQWEGIGPKPPLADLTEAMLRDMIARTYGMITLVDENVGRLLAALDETGLAESTAVVFTSDHGDLMGDLGLAFKGPFHLEGLISVPMIWRVPRACREGRGLGGAAGAHRADLFSSADLAPTCLDLAGAAVPEWMDGMGQADLVCGGAGRRDAAFIEFAAGSHPELNLRTVVTADRKLTYYPGFDFGELYDMTAALPEARNLWGRPGWHFDQERLLGRILEHEVRMQPRAPRVSRY